MEKTDPGTIEESAILVGVVLPGQHRWEVEENLAELKLLANTAGVKVADTLLQDRHRINPAYFIGSGKVEELVQLVKACRASAIIFDDDLSPAQVRNLENATGVKIIDRSALILDIFARHARTREARTQVELAQLQYLLPRLTRQWTHLSRQVGGIGTRGPGETQLETDRRLIRKRIEILRKELRKIDQQRTIRRKHRAGIFKVALIGYTNAGKSTIMNAMSNAGVLVEDQLFATLDSTVRRVWLDGRHQILLSDTVGFIRKLPHHLVASFKSTLDEVREAELLLHIVDISHPAFKEQISTVNEVLQDIGCGDKPILMVFNKIDLLNEKVLMGGLKTQFPSGVFMCARRQIGIKQLKAALIDFIDNQFVEGIVEVPLKFAGLINLIHSLSVVTEQEYDGNKVSLKFRCSISNRMKILRNVQKAIQEDSEYV